MAIIICRHGETYYNLEDRFQGISNSPLTPKGIKQAEKLNIFLKKYFEVKVFYLSPAMRVIQTFEIANKDINAKHLIDYRLREVSYGDWETKSRNEIDRKLLEEREKNRYEFTHPGQYNGIKGESYLDVFERVKPLFHKLDQVHDDVCIISHHGVILAAYKFYFQKSNLDLNKLRISNDEIIVVKNHTPRLMKLA